MARRGELITGILNTGWLHCDILLAEWEPWFFEVGNQHCTQWHHWPKWDIPMSCPDNGTVSLPHWGLLVNLLFYVDLTGIMCSSQLISHICCCGTLFLHLHSFCASTMGFLSLYFQGPFFLWHKALSSRWNSYTTIYTDIWQYLWLSVVLVLIYITVVSSLPLVHNCVSNNNLLTCHPFQVLRH